MCECRVCTVLRIIYTHIANRFLAQRARMLAFILVTQNMLHSPATCVLLIRMRRVDALFSGGGGSLIYRCRFYDLLVQKRTH